MDFNLEKDLVFLDLEATGFARNQRSNCPGGDDQVPS
jgi:hypothetical protein